jgi:hypothetical protein
VPRAIETPYKTDDTAICAKEGQLLPLYCDDHPEVIKRLVERTLELVRQVRSPLPFTIKVGEAEPNLTELWAAYRSPTRRQLHPGKFGQTHLHPDKVSYELRNLFDQAEAGSSEWMLVDAPFSDLYMAALALLLAEEQAGVVPVTSNAAEHGSAVYALLADSSDVTEPQPTTLISLTMKNLLIDPSTSVKDLIRFKQKRRHQLIELGAKLEELNAKIKETGDRKEIEYQAKKIYEREVEKGLNDLASELRAVSIQSSWDAFNRCMSLTVPAQTVAVTATHLPPQGVVSSALSLGAGALLTLTDVAVKTYFARRKTRKDSKYTYLLDAQYAFSAPNKSSAATLNQAYEQFDVQ